MPANPGFAEVLQRAWDDYEHGLTEEGVWMKEMDKFECLLQAYEYEQETHGKQDLSEFQGLQSKITSPHGKQLLAFLQAERELQCKKIGRRLPLIFVTHLITTPPLTDAEEITAQPCAQICTDLHFREICMRRTVAQYAAQTKAHSGFVADCLRANVAIPDDLLVNILEEEIEHVGGAEGPWILIHGFPRTLEQHRIFENYVQHENYMVRIRSQSVRDSEALQPTITTSTEQNQIPNGYQADVVLGTTRNLYQSMAEAIQGFVFHSSMMNEQAA